MPVRFSMRVHLLLALSLALISLPRLVANASAQDAAPAPAQVVDDWNSKQFRWERLDADRLKFTGQVEMEGTGANQGQKIFADEVEWNITTGEATAAGNVLVSSPTSRISAERAVLNTRTKLGTFYTASGIASLGERGEEDRTMFGALEPDMYFYGEEIHKIGEDKYRIHRGGFTSCVQPTPRWEIVSSTATINLGDYAILRNAVLQVKDVPIFYLPVLYYPIQEDDRATGLLIPTYGNSTYTGRSLSNAFFWAIDRSQDATLFHNWFFSRGQAVGGEYRYVAAPGSEGTIRTNWLDQKAGIVNGIQLGDRRSYQVESGVTHRLGGGVTARGRVNYFSDVSTQQLYNLDIYQATLSQRTIDGSLSGAWKGLSLTGTYRHNEQFYNESQSIILGTAPALTANLSSRRLGPLPAYFSFTSDSGRILYVERSTTNNQTLELDRSLGRVDLTPSIRAPLTSLPFLTLTGTVLYRTTYYTQSMAPSPLNPDVLIQVPEPLTRNYAEFRADFVGPVLSRVFTPNNAFADRLKHLVEPNVTVLRRTAIDEFDQVPNVGLYYDTVVGSVTQVNYGITNRFLLRRGGTPTAGSPAAGAPREFMSVGLSQSYYSDPVASRFDPQYQSGVQGQGRESNFSPVALTVRSTPSTISTASLRLEWDHHLNKISNLSAQTGLNHRNAQVTGGWSRSQYYNCGALPISLCNPAFTNHNLNAGSVLKFADGRMGGAYTINWDIERGTVVQQRWTGYYNAQCCGFVIEYQEFNFGTLNPAFPVPKDRRFNIGFTLAGVGTFSNPFGTFGTGGGRVGY